MFYLAIIVPADGLVTYDTYLQQVQLRPLPKYDEISHIIFQNFLPREQIYFHWFN